MPTNKERADNKFIEAKECLRHMRRFTDFENKKCLEIGCHFGGLSAYYALHGVKLEAIDCEQGEHVLEFAKDYAEKKGAPVTFSYGDVHELKYSDDSFDIVIMDNILEHLKDFRKALSECKRVLKKGGLLFMNFSLFYSPFGGHQETIPWYHILFEPLIKNRLERENIYGVYKTLNRITLRDARNAIKDFGFKVIYFHRGLGIKPHIKKLKKVTLKNMVNLIFF